MIVKITYDQNSEELLQLKKDFPNVKFEFYNDDYYKELKKSRILKAGLGARLTPFCGIYNDEKIPIKCFYSEVKECKYELINEYINEYNK